MIGDSKMVRYQLKTVNPYFQDMWTRKKRFDVRINDRNFKVGNTLVLHEFKAETGFFTGRKINTIITYILDTPDFCKEGYVILQLAQLFNDEVSQPKLRFIVDKWNKIGSLCPECPDIRVNSYDACFGWLELCLNPDCACDK